MTIALKCLITTSLGTEIFNI